MGENRLVYIVDDDEAVRRSESFMLRHAGYRVEALETGEAFLNIAAKAERGCVLLDIMMPGLSGLEVQQKMIEKGIDMPVIVLSGQGNVQMAVQAMRLGAINFIQKPYEKEELIDGLDEAFGFLEDPDLRQLSSSSLAKVQLACLTGREHDVMEELMLGNDNKEIAFNLDISPRSVDAYRANIMDKLRVKNFAQVLRIGFLAAGHEKLMARPTLA